MTNNPIVLYMLTQQRSREVELRSRNAWQTLPVRRRRGRFRRSP